MQVWVARLLVAVAGFAVWTLFSLPPLTGRPGIREAWDSPAYWKFGIASLLLAVAAVGYFSEDAPWKLAFAALAGHLLAMVLIKPAGTDFGLLPLSLLLVGLPGLAAFAAAAW